MLEALKVSKPALPHCEPNPPVGWGSTQILCPTP